MYRLCTYSLIVTILFFLIKNTPKCGKCNKIGSVQPIFGRMYQKRRKSYNLSICTKLYKLILIKNILSIIVFQQSQHLTQLGHYCLNYILFFMRKGNIWNICGNTCIKNLHLNKKNKKLLCPSGFPPKQMSNPMT